MIEMMLKRRNRVLLLVGIMAALFVFLAAPASADMAAAKNREAFKAAQARGSS